MVFRSRRLSRLIPHLSRSLRLPKKSSQAPIGHFFYRKRNRFEADGGDGSYEIALVPFFKGMEWALPTELSGKAADRWAVPTLRGDKVRHDSVSDGSRGKDGDGCTSGGAPPGPAAPRGEEAYVAFLAYRRPGGEVDLRGDPVAPWQAPGYLRPIERWQTLREWWLRAGAAVASGVGPEARLLREPRRPTRFRRAAGVGRGDRQRLGGGRGRDVGPAAERTGAHWRHKDARAMAALNLRPPPDQWERSCGRVA